MVKPRRIVLGFLLVAAPVAALLYYFVPSRQAGTSEPPPSRPSSMPKEHVALRQTILVPALSCPFAENNSAVWCASFQMAWDQLKTSVTREPIQLSGSKALVDQLNAGTFSKQSIDEESYYVAAGEISRGIVTTIREDMRRRFPGITPDPGDVAGASLIVYAYLRTSVPFKVPFFDAKKSLSFRDGSGQNHQVRAFGIRGEDAYAYRALREQVEVLYQLDKGAPEQCQTGIGIVPYEFALDLDRHSAPYQVIVAKVPRSASLLETWGTVGRRIQEKKTGPGITTNSVLLVPAINLATNHHFRELEGPNGNLLNSNAAGMRIDSAVQSVRFSLNRGGAELESEAKVIVRPLPYYFLLEGPFLVVMRKRGCNDPFLVLWVDNAELLEAWE